MSLQLPLVPQVTIEYQVPVYMLGSVVPHGKQPPLCQLCEKFPATGLVLDLA